MKNYMIVILLDGEQSAYFTDDYTSAHNARMDAECGLGAYVEMYQRIWDNDICEYRYSPVD